MFVIDFLGDLDVNCFVFFCLIFNIVEFLMMIGVIGFFMVFMVVLVWCLVQFQYKLFSFLRVIFRDEYIIWYKKVL